MAIAVPAEKDLSRYESLLKEAAQIRGVSLWLDAWRRLRKNWAAMISLGFLVALVITAFFTPLLPLQSPQFQLADKEHKYQRPSLESIDLNFELEVGQTTETIEVTGDAPLLDTASSSLGQVVDQRRILELPTFGGSVMSLVQLAPGVINTTDMRLAKSGSFSINKNSQVATDGAGVYNNEFTLDAVSNTQAEGGSTRVGRWSASLRSMSRAEPTVST